MLGIVLHAAATVGRPGASGFLSLRGPQGRGLTVVVGSFLLPLVYSELQGWSMALCMLHIAMPFLNIALEQLSQFHPGLKDSQQGMGFFL